MNSFFTQKPTELKLFTHLISTFWCDLWAIFSLMGWAKFWALQMFEYMWTLLKSNYFIFSLLHITLVQHRGRPWAFRFILSVPRHAHKVIGGEDPSFVRPPRQSDLATLAFGSDSLPSNLSPIGFDGADLPKILKNSGTGDSVASIYPLQVWILFDISLLNLKLKSESLSDNRCKGQFVESVAYI